MYNLLRYFINPCLYFTLIRMPSVCEMNSGAPHLLTSSPKERRNRSSNVDANSLTMRTELRSVHALNGSNAITEISGMADK
jgi:hypothetical protein